MNSIFSKIYEEILAHIEANMTDDNKIRYINFDLGQLDFYETRPPVSFPALLIDFDNFRFENLGEGIQLAQGNIILRLAHNPFSHTSNITPAAVREQGMKAFELEYELNKILHGWEPDNCSSFVRESSVIEKKEDAIRVKQIIYSIAFEDDSAQRASSQQNVPLITNTNFGT